MLLLNIRGACFLFLTSGKMAYVLLFSFSLFASTLMVGIAVPIHEICSMKMSSRYFTAVRYCSKEIDDKTDKAVYCNELYSLFQEICSFNNSIIDQAEPMHVTNVSCMILLNNLEKKYIQFMLNMYNGTDSLMTFCETQPDASAVLLALYQLKHLIPAKEEESKPNQAAVTSNITGEKSPVNQSADTAIDTVTRSTTVSPEKSSSKSTTASSTTSGNITSPASSPTQKKTTAATRGSDPIAPISNVTSTTTPSMPYTAAKKFKSQPTEKAAITGHAPVEKRNSSTEPAILRTTNTAAESPDPASNSSAVKSSSTTTTTTTTTTIAAATTTTEAGNDPTEKNEDNEAGNDSTGKNDEDNEAGNDSTGKNDEDNELTTNNTDKKDDKANPAEKVDTSKLEDNPSSYNFLIYFLAFIVLCVAVYIVLHNKHKIIAFIIEGKQGRKGGRPSTKQYTPLKSKVEDVMPFIEKSTTQSNYIY